MAEISFPELLKRQRESAAMSQSTLAKRADLDHSYVSRLEKNQRHPTRRTVLRLSLALRNTVHQRDELLAAAGYLPRSVAKVQSDVAELVDLQDLLASHQLSKLLKQQLLSEVRWIITRFQQNVELEAAS